MYIFFLLLSLFIAYISIIFVIHRFSLVHPKKKPLLQKNSLPYACENITLMSWNIGFAGMGKESDFMIDGGKNNKAPSKKNVVKNITGIINTLGKHPIDVFLFQEISSSSLLNFHVNIEARLQDALKGFLYRFYSEMRSYFIPRPLKFNHGLSLFSRYRAKFAQDIELPIDKTLYLGFLRMRYGLQLIRLQTKNKKTWSIINLHLSAFDSHAKIRKKQLQKALDVAQKEYAIGNYVIIGGDFNMPFIQKKFPYTTPKKLFSYLYSFPKEYIPKDWTISVDPSTPSFRTLEKPYVKGENYTAIIDGFITSPNIKIKSIKTLNQEFEFSDHNPIILQASMRDF